LLGVHAPEDFDAAFAAMTRRAPDAILMVTDVLTLSNRERVFDFAARHRLPAIYEYDFLVREGGLMSYGPDVTEMFDRAAELAMRILNGADPSPLRPAETHPDMLHCERPARFLRPRHQLASDHAAMACRGRDQAA
jgi:ABC-type uncharacterized transport system substrate-binding protein